MSNPSTRKLLNPLDQLFAQVLSGAGAKAPKTKQAEASIEPPKPLVPQWTSTHQVLLIWRQSCSCGSLHQWTQGVFTRQTHKTKPETTRLVHLAEEPLGLPRQVEFHDSHTHHCSNCSSEWLQAQALSTHKDPQNETH